MVRFFILLIKSIYYVTNKYIENIIYKLNTNNNNNKILKIWKYRLIFETGYRRK